MTFFKNKNFLVVLLLLVSLVIISFHREVRQETVAFSIEKEAVIQPFNISGIHHSEMESGYSCNHLSTQILYRFCSRASQTHTISAFSILQLHIISLLRNAQAVVLLKHCSLNFYSSHCPSCKYYVFALRKIII
jgi:hypothetical protein